MTLALPSIVLPLLASVLAEDAYPAYLLITVV
jgi:hypothetical protein